MRTSRVALNVLAVALAGLSLGACIAALPVAGLAANGLGIFKVAQTLTGGGKINFSFGADGKEAKPAPLPVARKVGVLPEGATAVAFAEKLIQSGRYDVKSPSEVQRVLGRASLSNDLKSLTESERAAAFVAVCTGLGIDQLFVETPRGTRASTGLLSLSRARSTTSLDIVVFGCQQRQTIWRDQMNVAVDLTGGRSADLAEAERAAGETWGAWMLQAGA